MRAVVDALVVLAGEVRIAEDHARALSLGSDDTASIELESELMFFRNDLDACLAHALAEARLEELAIAAYIDGGAP